MGKRKVFFPQVIGKHVSQFTTSQKGSCPGRIEKKVIFKKYRMKLLKRSWKNIIFVHEIALIS